MDVDNVEYDDNRENKESESEDDEELEVEEVRDESGSFPFDHATFLKKLREKPRLPEPKPCGASSSKNSSQEEDVDIPAANRLSVPPFTSLDAIRQRFPYPKGCVPPLALPSWHVMPLEKKIPYLQAGKDIFYYTRGKLGQKLDRGKPSTFDIRDPYNRERVVGCGYNTLHDPSTKALFQRPDMQDLLFRLGFINEENEVICSLPEFNKFRDYLRTVYCDQISQDVASTDDFIQSQREQLINIMRAESSSVGKDAKVSAKINAAREFNQNSLDLKRKMIIHRDQMNEARLCQWRADRERDMLEKIMKGIEDAKRTNERRQALYDLRLQKRRDILRKSISKFQETQERQQNDKTMMKAAYNKFLLEWIESKYVVSYEKLIEKRQIQEDLKAAQKNKATKRQERLEAYRKQMPAMLAKRKAEEERIWAIVRKYAMRWLEKVRKKRDAAKDENHESSFGQGKNSLEETVKYLRQESGYEKLDDFILNVIKLKKQIQAQIELEEAEEAAAATQEDGTTPEASETAITTAASVADEEEIYDAGEE